MTTIKLTLIAFCLATTLASCSKPEVAKVQEESAKPNVHAYQSYKGSPVLRKAMSDWYKKWYNVELNPDTEILPLIGSKEGIMHICMTYLNEDDEVLVPNPGYPTYTSVTKMLLAEAIYYDLKSENAWYPDFDELEKMDLSKVKLMWVNYPHMPTGAKADLKVFEKLIAFGRKHHIVIVNDNPYSFVLEDNPKSIFQIRGAKEVALELNSLSKTSNMAGWRVGFVAGKPEWISAISKVKSNMDSGMFLGIQQGAIAAMSLGRDWYEGLNEIYSKRRKLIWELAEKLGLEFEKDTAGMFVWAKLPQGKTSDELVDNLLYDKSIFVTPGHIFGTRGEGYVRFSLCVKEESIKEAIERLS